MKNHINNKLKKVFIICLIIVLILTLNIIVYKNKPINNINNIKIIYTTKDLDNNKNNIELKITKDKLSKIKKSLKNIKKAKNYKCDNKCINIDYNRGYPIHGITGNG